MSTSTKTTTTTTTTPHYRIVDIHSYLSSVEDELRSFGPNLRLNVKPQHVRSMIRTLLGIPHKVIFDEMLRNKRYEMERHKLIQFITNVLLPALIAMDDDDYKNDDDDDDNETTPSPPPPSSDEFSPSALRQRCQSILSSSLLLPPSNPRFKRSLFRIASGPRYRGNMMAFVRDVVPPDAIRCFETATEVVTEREAMMRLIEECIVVDEMRREMAWRCVNGEWYPDIDDGDTTNNNSSSNNGKSVGLQCEDECIKYLNERVSLMGDGGGSSVVYRNVFLRRHSTSKPITFVNEDASTATTTAARGFISTTAIDDGQCSEFDAAVVETTTTMEEVDDDDGRRLSTIDDCHCHYVGEIWEAKATLSPSALFDATRKKIAALTKIITDESSVFLHRDGTAVIGRRRRRRRCEAIINGESISSSSSSQSSSLPHLRFGIFGNEILSPTAAARQLVAISCQEASLDDVDMVMMAVKRGYFEIDADVAIERLVSYRRSLLEIDGNLDVMVVVIDDEQQ